MLGSLYRRPSGIYAVRIVVPRRHRPAVGRTEIHTSTGLRELNAAKLAALHIQIAWRTRFMELDRSKIETPNPLLLTDGFIGLQNAASALGIPLSGLLGELLNDRAQLFVQAQEWQGWWVPDIHNIERDYDDSYVLNDIEAKGIRQRLTALVQPFTTSAVVVGLHAGTASSSLFRLDGTAAFFTDLPQPIESAACFVQKKAVERTRLRLATLLPPIPEKSLAAPAPAIDEDSITIILDPITARHGKKRFFELFDLYRNDRTWKEEQRKRMTTEAGLFAELMDDPELGSIEKETIIEYAKRLATLPSDTYLTRRRFKVNTLRELIDIASIHNLERKGDLTVKRHVSLLSEILNYGMKNHMLRFNPAAEFKRGSDRRKRLSAQGDRDIFDQNDLARIFSAEWYVTGSGSFGARGRTHWRPFNYWLPLMGLLTGGRINELAQLYLDDVVQSESGVWYFDFNLNQRDKSDADASGQDKSLKTVNAIRIVPMHDTLVRLGLPEYVAALRVAKHQRLFPELTRDRVKGYGKPAGSWFNERFLGNKLGMVRNGKKVFHSFRHTFATALERLDAPESVRAQLAGHQRGNTESGTRYAKDRSAVELHALINRLHFPCLDNVAPFNVSAGLKALSVASMIKKINSRNKRLKSEHDELAGKV